MHFPRFWNSIVYLFILLTLVFSLSSIAQASTLAMLKEPICTPLRIECFPLPGSSRREKLIHEKIGDGKEFKAPNHKIYKLPDTEKENFSTRQQNCAGLDCLQFYAEQLAQQLGNTS